MKVMRLSKVLVVVVISFLATASKANLPDFTELVEELSPAVVKITATAEAQVGTQQQIPQIFRDFFGDSFPQYRSPTPQPRNSLGSGFLISDDGYVLTNNHVIDGADQVSVRLTDGRELMAEVVGTDAQTDLALLKLEERDLPEPVEFGDSEDLKVGEWVLAIGSPYGFEYSVTAGIVSAKGRALPNDNYVPFIQTDVAINPGNSGGPLFNLDGEVIGINSQIFTRDGGFMGLSFAIPSNLAESIVAQLKDGGVERGYLGVAMDEKLNDSRDGPILAEILGLDRPEGALIAKVYPGTAAEAAGIQQGDVILSFDGNPIRRYSDLAPLVGLKQPGDEVEVGIVRDGKRIRLDVVLGERADMTRASVTTTEPESNRLAIAVRALTDEESDQLQGENGVLVTQVGDGQARRAGVMPGDIITNVAGQSVSTPRQLEQALDDIDRDKPFAMRVVRQGRAMFVAIRP
ncbi:DegQ family serine endoprotease [Salinibius halmophilus]|uniref:DegQ family serine endoprotease n=1 Tax=Salinibius halmophilus TaxID=1853216 RepID=UPI001F295499|nr:DegQ family serine endoprotease [Salinibius halmophilus]